MELNPNWSIYVSSVRLLVISGLLIFNGAALWKGISSPMTLNSRQINKLAVISILVVNLTYLSLVWAPFTLGSFKHDIMDYNHQQKSSMTDFNGSLKATVEELSIPEPSNLHELRQRRWAKIETTQEHKGTWAIVFPVTREPERKEFREALPIFLNVDCGFQDCITTSCCYSLAFIAVIKLILTRKPLSLPMSGLALTGYTSLLAGVPLLATLAIRYTEKIGGSQYSPHEPERSSTGYTFYNIICDMQVSDNFVFMSFLEWAGLMMVLLLTVTSFLGISSKSEIDHPYSDHLTSSHKLSLLEKCSYKSGHYTRDAILGLGVLWSWPMKPCAILLTYVVYGKHWTNSISWISHTVVTASVIFIALATFICNGTFDDEHEGCHISNKSSKKKSSKLTILTPTLLTGDHSRDGRPPSYEEYSRKYFRQINGDEETDSPVTDKLNEEIDKNNSKSALDIKNKLQKLSEPSERKLFFKLNKKPEDTKIIINHAEESTASFSEV